MGKEDGCLICEKQKGNAYHPPGGYIYKGRYFAVCHAPLNAGPAGTLFIESRRHLLDYTEMNANELAAYGPLLKRVYTHLRAITGAERIYQVAMIDGVAHFHCWLVPRRRSDTVKGIRFLAMDLTADESTAMEIVNEMRTAMAHA